MNHWFARYATLNIQSLFFDVLSYAEDARVLRDLVARLRTDADEVRRRYVVTTAALGALNENHLRISKVLDTRKR